MNLPNLKEARLRTNKEVLTINYKLSDEYINIGNNKKYFIKTYGCQMNEHDSENISAILESMGFLSCDNYEDADLVILNTCSIRENANNKVFGMLGRLKHLKENKKNLIVGLAGCMSQEEIIIKEIQDKYKWIDFVLGTHNIDSLPSLINDSIKDAKQNIEVYSIEGNIIENMPSNRKNKYTAFVNIMYGCDKFCTYCIVPYTRGKQRSRLSSHIINEVKDLKNKGYKEVILLGQNVNAYGKDLKSNYGMCELLQDVCNTGIERVRFVTSHPWDFTDKMINTIKENKNIMPSIHLPVQSGSSKILKLMGRRYSKEDYLTLFNKLKDSMPNICISTDIIVGFPNETDEDFKETIDLVNKCKFDLAYTFIYSKRTGTPAANMEDKISQEIKEERLHRLNELVNKYMKESNLKYLNKTVKVLALSISEKDPTMICGYTEENKLVNFVGDKSLIGQIVNVLITDAKSFSLDGKVE